MESIENELLIKIISYLPPQDLYSLTLVNKRYRSLLWSTSPATQTIWRNSRSRFLTYPSLPPPIWMSEQKYIWFTLLAKSCQICSALMNVRNNFPKNWEFGIVYCNRCFEENTISIFKDNHMYPPILLTCVPCIERGIDNESTVRIFWLQELEAAEKEFLYLYDNIQTTWVKQKQKQVLEFMEQVFEYKRQDLLYLINRNY
ncbi:554_t:CDS:2 [Acaulospora morrowiae]|uniref:554_t:CDS:1 n=1 Tax=Acaulospora morrowiae TaxID=94023 RepID=A0A9N9ADA7_9GLOM|nr:554_t:CDS:2 [Acaulospora morrowiae]